MKLIDVKTATTADEQKSMAFGRTRNNLNLDLYNVAGRTGLSVKDLQDLETAKKTLGTEEDWQKLYILAFRGKAWYEA